MAINGQRPAYVSRPSDACHEQPYACNATQLYGFYIRGDAATMQRRLINPCLNAVSNGKTNYRTFTDLVLVSYARAGHCTSTTPPDSNFGWVVENSWTLWVPAVAVKSEFGIHVAQRLVLFPAYICVDNSWSYAAGREVYGFPKCYGVLDIPAAEQPPQSFSVSTLVSKDFDPAIRCAMAPLMQVTRTADGTAAGAAWADAGSAIKAIAHIWTGHSGGGFIPGINLAIDLVELLRHEAVPGVFLKQFRDAADGNKACYQAIIEANSGVTKLHGGGLLGGKFEASVANYRSHPIVEDLGLPGSTVDAEFPFWVNFDFTIGPGAEIWKAGGNA